VDVRARLRDRLGPRRVARAKRAVAPLLRGDLTRLGRFYGTDKAYDHHRYTPLYERHLAHRRRDPLCVLEIGIGGYADGTGGSSLRMWRTYFRKARIYGVDIEERDLREPRITTFRGSQSDPEFLRGVIDQIGVPDVVIDDGSHRSDDTLATFDVLFPVLAGGGLYVIEDLHTSYRADYGGGPPGTNGTTMERVKRLVDDLARRRVHDGDVAAVHAYPRIVFIEKRGVATSGRSR
jgi:hypothetical protein